jgi:hypothetical protein
VREGDAEAALGCVGEGVAVGATQGGAVDGPAWKGGTTVGDTRSRSRNTSSLVRGNGRRGKGEIRLVENDVTRDEDSV